jgi:hypothetical protein
MPKTRPTPLQPEPDAIYDTRRRNVRQLIANWGGPTRLALKLGHANGSYVSHVAGPNPSRTISENVARAIEQKLALPRFFLDKDNNAPATLPGELPPVLETPRVAPGLLAQVTKAVLVALENLDVKDRPPIDKVGDIVELAYQHGTATGVIDAQFIDVLVRLSK